MIKTLFILFFLFSFFINQAVNSADTGPSVMTLKKSDPVYADAKQLVKDKKFSEAAVMLEEILKDSKNASNADILNDYGYSLRKLKQYEKAEKYYLAALKINPNHTGANEYLGELYLETQRPELAKKRLEVLKSCNCDEFKLLKANIDRYKPDAPFVPTSSW
jgi:tetratricopeptide (TPR) repeat protein